MFQENKDNLEKPIQSGMERKILSFEDDDDAKIVGGEGHKWMG